MARPEIVLYVDTVSPFAYQAYWLLRQDPAFQKCDVKFVPMFLGGVMMATGNTAPINVKNKDKWVGRERQRWSTAFDIPMKETNPPNFPPLTLYIMRALAALTIIDSDQEVLCKALDGFYEELWCHHTEIHKPEHMERILIKAVGEELAKKALAMAPKEGKALLLKNTDEALAEGAFGLPWMVCTNSEGKKEGFWGFDHFGQIVDFLGIDRPKQKGWKALL